MDRTRGSRSRQDNFIHRRTGPPFFGQLRFHSKCGKKWTVLQHFQSQSDTKTENAQKAERYLSFEIKIVFSINDWKSYSNYFRDGHKAIPFFPGQNVSGHLTSMHIRIQWVSPGGHALAGTTRSRRRGISLLQLKLSLVYMTANRIQITQGMAPTPFRFYLDKTWAVILLRCIDGINGSPRMVMHSWGRLGGSTTAINTPHVIVTRPWSRYQPLFLARDV